MYDYGEACPISRATAILCERWTLQIVREMTLGASRFSEFQRYLPKISPTLLNSRLRFLEEQGVLIKRRIPEKRGHEYRLSPAGKALAPVLHEMGKWGMEWAHEALAEEVLDAVVLLREIALFIDTDALPDGDLVFQFTFVDLEERSKRYLLLQRGRREVCDENPGYEVDVFFKSTLKTLSEIWWGDVSLTHALREGRLSVTGASACTRRLSKWFPVSSFARYNPRGRTSRTGAP